MLKQRVARKLLAKRSNGPPTQIALPFESDGQLPRAFWQARFYDFNVYSRGKVKEKLNYMHANPVIRKLLRDPRDWMWRSWSNYARDPGPIEIDFV
jgi:hypothetical protein